MGDHWLQLDRRRQLGEVGAGWRGEGAGLHVEELSSMKIWEKRYHMAKN